MFRTLLAICLFLPFFSSGQKIDKKLTAKLEKLFSGYKGVAGIYVKNLRTNKTASINADTVFPTASIVKIPILVGIMDKINRNEFAYHQEIVYRDSLAYSSYDVTANLKDSAKIEMAKVIMLMLTTSDNTASLWLQKLSGTGTRINAILDSIGFINTRVNSRTPGREANRTEFGWGQTTPSEMARLLEKIYRGEIINDSLSKKMIRLLGRNFWDEQSISQVPETVFVASKNGAVDASRSEVLLVMGKDPYIFSFFTKNNQDKSWGDTNEAWMLAKKISKLLWETYGD